MPLVEAGKDWLAVAEIYMPLELKILDWEPVPIPRWAHYAHDSAIRG